MTRKGPTLPKRWSPRFLADTDRRSKAFKVVRQRTQALVEDTGAESFQQRQLCQRAAFLSLLCETLEVDAVSGAGFDLGDYTKAASALTKVLQALGLEKRVHEIDLGTYLQQRGGA